MKRLWVALGAFAVLAVLAWTTIDDQKFRLATLAILAMFAIRTWSWQQASEEREQTNASRELSRVERQFGKLGDRDESQGGSNSVVESQPSKLLVAGSIPVSRSRV